MRCRCLLRRVPGGLAIAVTLLGTIMAATTGIVGASVVMLTLIALPVMMQRGYNKELAVGTIASAGTLGILIPPSIMLVIMGDLMTVPVGTLFAGAIIPGLVMSSALRRLHHHAVLPEAGAGAAARARTRVRRTAPS